jgi:hypothetical protein
VEADPDPNFVDLPWYRPWLNHQIQSQSQRLLLALPTTKSDQDDDWNRYFLPLWNKVRELLLVPGPRTIDGITDALVTQGLVSVTDHYEGYQSAKELVFAVLGWQTMLYKPADIACATQGFHLLDELNGYRGDARVCLNQSPLSSKYELPTFLLGFGMMLPPRGYCAFGDADDEKLLFDKTRVVVSKDLHAHVLTKVCGLKVQWVDSLSCHLEVDKHSGTLFIYRYPSFCVSSLQAVDTNERRDSIIYSCGVERPGPVPWASKDDIKALLQEILLSYRLLFGQSSRSRKEFRRERPFSRMPREAQDHFLSRICGKKRFNCPITLVERDEYDLAGDFPHLQSRIVRLHNYASSKKPRSIRQLWQDKRDSTAWLAFWSVLVFGSVSILLGLIQTVFQVLQYFHEAK